MFLKKFAVISAVICVVGANTCKAEPGKEIIELMEKPISLFEWGFIKLEKNVGSVVRLESIQNEGIKGPAFEWTNVSVIYEETTDKLNLNFTLTTNDRDNRRNLCRNTMTYIKENLTVGFDLKDPSDVTFVGSAFLPYTIKRKDKYSEADIRRSRYIDSITHINIVVEINNDPHDFTQCSSRLTEIDMSLRDFPPNK